MKRVRHKIKAGKRVTELTKRQVEIVKEICTGKSNRELTNALNIKMRTLETYRLHIYKKLGVKTPIALFIIAHKNNLININKL